jgi:hypothetical protein
MWKPAGDACGLFTSISAGRSSDRSTLLAAADPFVSLRNTNVSGDTFVHCTSAPTSVLILLRCRQPLLCARFGYAYFNRQKEL